MTRFARAKGSKSSNERVPEDPTPWGEMKQQLLESRQEQELNEEKQEMLRRRNENYKSFLEEREQEHLKKSEWADFATGNAVRGKNPEKKSVFEFETNVNSTKRRTEELKTLSNENSDSDEPPAEESSKVEMKKPVIKMKTKRKKLNIIANGEAQTAQKRLSMKTGESEKRKHDDTSREPSKKKLKLSSSSEEKYDETEGNTVADTGKSKKRKSKMKKSLSGKEKVNEAELTERDLRKIEKKKQKRIKQLLKKKQYKEALKKQRENQELNKQLDVEGNSKTLKQNLDSVEELNNSDTSKPVIDNRKSGESKKESNNFRTNTKNGNFKKRDRNSKEPHERRKPYMPHKMFINGKDLDISYIEGFPIKKEDAERIIKLRKEMISKGLPRSEIDVALKLERRKAEKALAREKKKVCFNCRISGHNLSECPELNKDQFAETAGSGICFKCGSTEHTHFMCKVVRGQEFKYAQCFICHEQGHIARQCPDNARGLYPKGGACRVCGDVTHLKKDCPKHQAQQQQVESGIKIGTFNNGNPDDMDADGAGYKQSSKSPNKLVKFL